MTTTPSPLMFAKPRPPKPLPPRPEPQIIAAIEPTDPGNVVTLGLVPELVESLHDGVVKTKQLKRGQRVRPFVHGKPCGGERIVERVTKVDNGAVWHVEFATAHPAQDFKAAYRWHDESLVGTTRQEIIKVPGFVPAHEA